MQNKKPIIIITCIVLISILIVSLLFELKTVPDTDWRKSFDYKSKEPRGLYVFNELVNEYFASIDVKQEKLYQDTLLNNGLYINGTDHLSQAQLDTALSIAEKGNDVFIFNSYLIHTVDGEELDDYYSDYVYDNKVDFTTENKKNTVDRNYTFRMVDKYLEYSDTTRMGLIGNYYYKDNEQAYPVTVINDTLSLMIKLEIGKGRLYYHVLPEIFFNHAYRQEGMFEYTEDVLSNFDPDYVVILDNLIGEYSPSAEHPLQYIMSSPPLKSAYYLLIITLLVYAFIGSRRKQKAIPITDKNENTSLEYIDTVSQLFYQQKKHEKLVAHMKKVFYHRMYKKFYIKEDQVDYLLRLHKKSKIPESDLKYILDRFRNHDENYTFHEDQLVKLHTRLEQIYQHIENS